MEIAEAEELKMDEKRSESEKRERNSSSNAA